MPYRIDLHPSLTETQLISTIYQATHAPEYWYTLLKALYQLTLTDTSADLIARIEHHLIQAQSIAKHFDELKDRISVFSELIDHIPVGLMLVGSDGHIEMANRLADEALKEGDYIQQVQGKLQAWDASANKELAERIKAIAAPASKTPESRGVALPSKNGDRAMAMAIISPLQGHQANPLDSRGMALVFVTAHQEQVRLELAIFADIYRLTPKETRVAEHIVQGLSPQRIASRLHVSYNTVRSQLKSIYQKTRTQTQIELVNLVLSGPGGMLFQVSQEPNFTKITPHMQRIRLSDGRLMSYQEHGDPYGKPIIYCHSALGSKLEYLSEIDWANRLGLRLIAPERPGYGFSDPLEHTSGYQEWIDDLVELLDALHIPMASLIGYGAGSIYASTAAAQLPDRVNQLVLVSPIVYPTSQEEQEQLSPLYQMHIHLARCQPRLHQLCTAIMKRGLRKDPSFYFDLLNSNIEKQDASPYQTQTFQMRYLSTLRDASRQGERAFSEELARMIEDWPFVVSEIQCPITIWYGDGDISTSLQSIGRFYLDHPNIHLQVMQGQSQLLLYQHWPDILNRLLQQLSEA
jgi:pimeloyl-ACP methyl ester carboxylesterase/DNA-binding CsgD family transcriptional regulator